MFLLVVTWGGLGGKSIPSPCMNMISAGKNAYWKSSFFEEYMIIPMGEHYWDRFYCMGEKVHKELGNLFEKKGIPVNMNFDGSFIPLLKSNNLPLELLIQATENAGFIPGHDIALGINAAAGELYVEGHYAIDSKNTLLDSLSLINYYDCLKKEFPLHMILSGLARDDVSGMKMIKESLGDKTVVVGDDLLCTKNSILNENMDSNLATSTTIYPYSLASVSEVIAAVTKCRDNKWIPFFIGNEMGQDDVFISELAIAFGADYIKMPAPVSCTKLDVYKYISSMQL